MTAEIVIMNKMAVALAADSKVTIGSEGQEKTFDTVNKLFTLSRIHPVGIMIFGNAEFMEYPWETIIKEYRNQKMQEDEDTIDSWSADFLNYLRSNFKFSKTEWVNNVRSLSSAIFSDIITLTQRQFLEDTSKKAFEDIIEDIMRSKLEEANSCGEFLTDNERSFQGATFRRNDIELR